MKLTKHEENLMEFYKGLCKIARTFSNGFITWPSDQPEMHNACEQLAEMGLLVKQHKLYDGKAQAWEVVFQS